MRGKLIQVARPQYIVSVLAISGIAFAAANFTNPPLFNSLDNFVLFAQEEIKLEQGVQVSSGDIGSNERIDIEKGSIINGNLFVDRITIDKNVIINGNASFNKLKLRKESKILGTQTKPVQLPIAILPEIPDFQIGTQDFKFEGKENTISSSSYRDIILEKNSRLTLTGGVYNLRKLELKENSTLIFSSPTTLNIKQELKGQEHIVILPGGNNFKPTDLVVNYQGQNEKDESDKKDKDKNQDKEEPEGTKPIELGQNSFLNFKLLAPRASVHIGKESTVKGQVLARKIKIAKNSILSFKPWFAVPSKPEDFVSTGGAEFAVNVVEVNFVDGATFEDALRIAMLLNGRIVGFGPVTNLYGIQIPTRTVPELEAAIQKVEALNDPKIEGVFEAVVAAPK